MKIATALACLLAIATAVDGNRYSGGGHRGGHGGGHNRKGRSIEEDQPLAVEQIQPTVESVSDLVLVGNRRGGYSGGYGSNYGGHSSGYGNSGFNRPSGGYGGGHGRGRY